MQLGILNTIGIPICDYFLRTCNQNLLLYTFFVNTALITYRRGRSVRYSNTQLYSKYSLFNEYETKFLAWKIFVDAKKLIS